MPGGFWAWVGRKEIDDMTPPPFVLQKADGTCNTNFKKTQELEQVTKVLKEFVDGDLEVLVSRSPVHTLYPSWVEVIGGCCSCL